MDQLFAKIDERLPPPPKWAPTKKLPLDPISGEPIPLATAVKAALRKQG